VKSIPGLQSKAVHERSFSLLPPWNRAHQRDLIKTVYTVYTVYSIVIAIFPALHILVTENDPALHPRETRLTPNVRDIANQQEKRQRRCAAFFLACNRNLI
jgi:hypothetical protein